MPRDERETKFCEIWLRTHDAPKAWVEAGYSEKAINRKDHLKKLAALQPYIEEKQAAISKEFTKQFVLDQQVILDEMIAVGFANPRDYIEEVMELQDGKPVKALRRKNIMSLTRAQAAAVTEIEFHPDGTVTYKLPDAEARHPFLKELGMHLGLFHPKLIQEHRHRHMHAHIDMKDIDQTALEQAETMLLEALGTRGNLLLGLQRDDEEEDA